MTKEEIEELRIEYIEERISIIMEDGSVSEQDANALAVKRWLRFKRLQGWLEQDRMI